MNQINKELIKMGQDSKEAARVIASLSTEAKNEALNSMAEALLAESDYILKANAEDLAIGKEKGLTDAFLDRLALSVERIQGMSNGLKKMARLEDPTLKTDAQWINEDGLKITKRRVPLGVVGIIYEARPNVTADATGLCLKAGNAVILRGGSDALKTNKAVIKVLHKGLASTKVPQTAVQLITDPSRELAGQFMKLNEYIDCLIPRGGAGLIQTVLKQATVPVIETGVGNCHLYIHNAADLEKATKILFNGKTQRPSVCNAVETLVIDRKIAEKSLKDIVKPLLEAGVEIRGEEDVQAIIPEAVPATEEDYSTEFLAEIIVIKIVDNYSQAVNHISHYSTGHSDAIVTQDYDVAQDFMNDIDSSSVYVNASTRFSDGEVFGFGGEIGISTQKLHARGPMGLDALTSYKYVIEGSGQIRQ